MLISTHRGRRIAGTTLIVASIAIVLPLTATRAIDYVDVLAAPKPVVAPVAPVAPVAVVAAHPPVAPVAPVAPTPHWKERGMIDGKNVSWHEMTAEERGEMRRELAEARREIAGGRAEAAREIAEARRELEAADIEGEIAGARLEIETAMRDIDANAAELRKGGHDPEMIKAQVRASLQNLDVAAIKRSALAGIDEKAIEASIRAAEQSIARMEAELDRLDRKHH